VALAAAAVLFGPCASGGEFAGIRKAKLDFAKGTPRLLLDGKPTPPLIYFHNAGIRGERSQKTLREQVALARDAGVHIYSMPLHCPRRGDDDALDFSRPDAVLDRFIAVDPEALFIPRLYPGPNWSWKAWREKSIPEGEFVRFKSGRIKTLSIASETFRKGSNRELAELIARYESSKYGKRILAWHPGGPRSSEMFLLDYRKSGPDYSDANQRGFRAWLRKKYKSDAALGSAWGRKGATLEKAAVPEFAAKRFPVGGGIPAGRVRAFYDLPRERDWVDYSAYTSDVTVERILDWARIIKKGTGGRKLAMFFYGYTFELPSSISGHCGLGKVLASADVDLLCSPYSYQDRPVGGAGNFMCPIDSIAARRKLWITEDDTRTSILDLKNLPEHFGWNRHDCRSLPETLNVLDRNLGSNLVHRAGTWWMDLLARGAFSNKDVWELMRKRKRLFEERDRDPSPFRPEVALIVDEEAKLYVRDDWHLNRQSLVSLREECVKTGASVGYYLLEDLLAGRVPKCRAYLFANAYHLGPEQVAKIHARVEGATAIWMYAPGWLGSGGAGAAGVARASGIAVTGGAGKLGSKGRGPLAGENWGRALEVTPRISITEKGLEVLGRYAAGGTVSAARRKFRGFDSVLLCDWFATRGVLRKLFERAGCHIWTRGSAVVQSDGRLLLVHAAAEGTLTLRLPEGVSARPADTATKIEIDGREVRLKCRKGTTALFRLVRRAGPGN
jgi:hypothetical protein